MSRKSNSTHQPSSPSGRNRVKESPASTRLFAPANSVAVRMYRTGLGDCFLLAFPRSTARSDGHDTYYMLIDCGVYKGTPRPRNAPRIHQIVSDIRDATGGRLDLLVITHEHWDHISAFHKSQAQELFAKEIELGALWMAWTEDPENPLAKSLQEGRKAAAMALLGALNRIHGLQAEASAGSRDLMIKVLDFFGLDHRALSDSGMHLSAERSDLFGARSLQSSETMTWIRESYGKGKVKFLRPCERGIPEPLDGVSNVRVYVLGPPEDPTLIRRSNPSAEGTEVFPKSPAMASERFFFAACDGTLDPSDNSAGKKARLMALPFDPIHGLAVKEVEAGPARFVTQTDQDSHPFVRYFAESEKWRTIDSDWLGVADEFALQLDSATNNTSLALAIEIGPPGHGRVLLFPGDAQVGNWESWFGPVEIRRGGSKKTLGKPMIWSVGRKKISAEDLLNRTVLYKVGHHGSHNATLREKGLFLMGPPHGSRELVAMLPVDEEVAKLKAGYGQMPLSSLVKELLIRTEGRVLRNDDGDPVNPRMTDPTRPRLPGAPEPRSDFAKVTDLYFEVTIPFESP